MYKGRYWDNKSTRCTNIYIVTVSLTSLCGFFLDQFKSSHPLVSLYLITGSQVEHLTGSIGDHKMTMVYSVNNGSC